MRASLDPMSKMRRDVKGKRLPFLEVKLLPGVGRRVDLSEGLTRDEAIEVARGLLNARFFGHTAWLHLTEDDHVFLRGVN